MLKAERQQRILALMQETNVVTVRDLAQTDRKFNRMRPSMARVLGLETRSAKEG